MATQELIWLYSDDYIKWMDKYSSDGSLGNQINIDTEKNEILRLVNSHNNIPSLVEICSLCFTKKLNFFKDVFFIFPKSSSPCATDVACNLILARMLAEIFDCRKCVFL